MQFMKFTTCMCHAAHFNDLTRFKACSITTVIITDQITLPAFQEGFSMLARTAILKVIDHRLNWSILCGGIGPDITLFRLLLTDLHHRYWRSIRMPHLLSQHYMF